MLEIAIFVMSPIVGMILFAAVAKLIVDYAIKKKYI